MQITSTSFNNNGKIPVKYGCSGKNISPQLSWGNFPVKTKSFALTCIDPDSPSGKFIHWMIVNIPLDTCEIQEGKMKIDEALNIVNDFGKNKYGGPCPATGTHHYIFTIYSLNIDKIENIDKNNLQEKIKPYVIDQAQIIGQYKKNKGEI